MSDLRTLEVQVRARRRDLDREAGLARALALQGKQYQGDVQALQTEVDQYDRVAGVLNKMGEERQESVQREIEVLVTRGLQTIFGADLSFHVVSEIKAKVSATDFVVRTTFADGTTLDTPVMDSRGGGLAAVVGFLLRLVVMLLSPGARRFMVLDETFAALSVEYEGRLAEFIRELVDRTETQVLLVTHSDAYSDYADNVYRFSLDSRGRTQVKEGPG